MIPSIIDVWGYDRECTLYIRPGQYAHVIIYPSLMYNNLGSVFCIRPFFNVSTVIIA